MEFKVKDISLAKQGRLNIEWAENHMPVMMELRKRYAKSKPLKGLKIAGCLHVTKETAVLVETLKMCGAQVAWSGCNPLSTQDDVAAALAKAGIPIFAWRGNHKEYYWCIEQVLKIKPHITVDDGADLVFTIHKKHRELIPDIIGGCEETATGMVRIRAMAAEGKLSYPIISVSDAQTKFEFDSTWGTGQSTVDGILRATNLLLAGKKVVIGGFGHVASGIAKRMKGMGAHVTVCEVDPVKALKAAMEGFNVSSMDEASKFGDLFVTATGCKHVITTKHIRNMKNGAIVANSGHFNVEIDVAGLEKLAKKKRTIRKDNVEYTLPNGKKIYLLAEGRLVNISAAEGHPSSVMDMSFANQFLSVLRLAKSKNLEPKVYEISREQDNLIAGLKLKSMGMKFDNLTKEQEKYLCSWEEGT
jgi:adenosylhomocysteinase